MAVELFANIGSPHLNESGAVGAVKSATEVVGLSADTIGVGDDDGRTVFAMEFAVPIMALINALSVYVAGDERG
jgi:hypothetical protein